MRAISDGGVGLTAVDTATGKARRLPVDVDCGDAPACLISTGNELVISSPGDTTMLDPSAPGPPEARRFGRGWITVPSVDPGHVWLGILARGKLGDSHSRGLGEVQEVDLQGNVIRRMRPHLGHWPAAAVSSGLLFQGRDHLHLWDFDQRHFTLRVPGVFPSGTAGSLVASCGERCPRLFITDTESGRTARVAPPRDYRWIGGYHGAFAPDGAHLAAPVAVSGAGSSRVQALAIVDVASGRASLVPPPSKNEPAYGAMTWSTDGTRLYFARPNASVVSYSLGAAKTERVAGLDRGDVILQMVAVAPAS